MHYLVVLARDMLSEKGTVLVTGGAGFIGSHVSRELLAQGFKVVILDDLSGGFIANIPKGALFVEGSILDRSLLARLFCEYRFRYVYHLAAYAAEGLSHFIRHFNYQNNLVGSINLINLSVTHRVERFIFTSSIAVYGAGQSPMKEDLTPQPEDPYGIAKYAVELDLKSAHELFGLKYTIFRPHNVYGEGQNVGDRYRNVIGIFMNQVMQGKPLTVFGDGEQTRAFSYISDVVQPMVHCLNLSETEGETFNVGADTPYTVNQLAREVLKVMNSESNLIHLEARLEVQHAFTDHSKVRTFFKDLPDAVSLHEGLKRMAAWAVRQGPQRTKAFGAVEIADKMPPSWRAEFELSGQHI